MNKSIARRVSSSLPLIFLLSASATLTNPQRAIGEAAKLPARWIAVTGATQKVTGVFSFKKLLAIDRAPSTYVVHVSADDRFILYVNGKRIGDGPARGDLPHWRYETFDIAPALHAGTNVIAARVWSFGDQKPAAQISLRSGFILWSETDSQNTIDTDESWESRTESAWTYAPTGPPINSLVGPNEIVDGKNYDWNWTKATDVKGWALAQVIAEPIFETHGDKSSSAQAWMLTPDKLPAMEYTDEPAGNVVRASGASSETFPSEAVTIKAHTHASFILDRGFLTTAYPELKVSGGAGATIRLTYSEALINDHGEKSNRNDIAGKHMDPHMQHDEFIADGGSDRLFEPLWWRTWRFMQVDIDTQSEPIRLDSLRSRYTAYPFMEKAYFRSSDPSLQKIWDVGWRTLRLDAHETYMDCPYWEQSQYIGDTRIEALASYVVSGDGRLVHQAMDAFADSILPSGLTQSHYPASGVQIIPPFSLLWIGMLHDYWMYQPDPDTVKTMLPATRPIIDYFSKMQRSDGLLGKLPEQGFAFWNFVDWTGPYAMGIPPEDADGGSVPITLQFTNALLEAADLEEKFGDASRASTYRAQAARTTQSVYREAWDPTLGLLADTPSHHSYSQQANILGVLTNAIPETEQAKVLHLILQKELSADPTSAAGPQLAPASYYFRFYLSRAVDHAGLDDMYLQTLGPWRGMLRLGLTTWAEQPEPTRSDAHAWSSHPNYDLLTLVAGIKPDAPGFERVLIAPHLGELTSLEAAMPHPDGLIRVTYSRAGKSVTAKIELPPGLSGRFILEGQRRSLHSGLQEFTLPTI